MKALALTLLTIALFGCNGALKGTVSNPGDTQSVHAQAQQDVADIKALEERFTVAFRDKDVNAIMQFCIPDDSLVIFDVHPPRQVQGPNAYRKDWEDYFNTFSGPIEADISQIEVTAGADVAYVHYIHHVVGTLKAGKKSDVSVRVTDCLKKINGNWLIAHSHISVPVDMRTEAADMQSKP